MVLKDVIFIAHTNFLSTKKSLIDEIDDICSRNVSDEIKARDPKYAFVSMQNMSSPHKSVESPFSAHNRRFLDYEVHDLVPTHLCVDIHTVDCCCRIESDRSEGHPARYGFFAFVLTV